MPCSSRTTVTARVEAGQLELAVGLRERPADQDDAGDQAGDQDEHQADGDVHRDPRPRRGQRAEDAATTSGRRARESTGLAVDWSVMVLAIVPYHWQSSGSSASTRVPARTAYRRMTPCRPTSTPAPSAAHAFEQFQSFTDDALTECPECGGRLRKLFNAVGVVFKGPASTAPTAAPRPRPRRRRPRPASEVVDRPRSDSGSSGRHRHQDREQARARDRALAGLDCRLRSLWMTGPRPVPDLAYRRRDAP